MYTDAGVLQPAGQHLQALKCAGVDEVERTHHQQHVPDLRPLGHSGHQMVFEIAGIHEIQALVDPHGEHLGAGDYRVPLDVAVMLRPGYPADDGDVWPACAPEIERSEERRVGKEGVETGRSGWWRD